MNTLLRLTIMLLVAGSLQRCQDYAFGSLESKESSATLKPAPASTNDKHAFTISAVVNEELLPYNHFLVSLSGRDGSIMVNWGDGTSTTYVMDGNLFDLEKQYESPGQYVISITGDLKDITGFHSSYGQGLLDAINLRPLTGLMSLSLDAMPGPEVIDVSHNRKLETLTLTDLSELREIRLPKQHSLSGVSLAASTSLTTSTVDALINSIYQNAVKDQISFGFLHVIRSRFDDGSTEMVGPPSARSIAQLTELQNVYSWEILPVMPSPTLIQNSRFKIQN